jgi:zinc protease
MLTTLKETVRTNQYWLYSVLALSGRHRQQLDWPGSILRDYGGISTGEISKLAAIYLSSGAEARVVVLPKADK